MGFHEVFDGEFGVVLEGFEVFVSEDLLDMIKIRSAADQFGGAASAEGVAGDVNFQAGLPGLATHDAPEGVVGLAVSGVVEDERLLIRSPNQERTHGFEVTFQEAQGGLADGHQTLFVAIARHDGGGGAQVNVAGV